MGSRRDDFDRFEKPFLGRVLDDVIGGTLRAVVWAFRGFAWVVFQLTLAAPLRLLGNWRAGLVDKRRNATILNMTLGLPAVAAGLTLATLATLIWRTSASEISGRYRAAAKEARDAGDVKSAMLYFERNRVKDSGNLEHAYELALLNELEGNVEKARNLMQQVANEDERVGPNAHAWLAAHMLSQPLSPSQVEVARTHINRVLKAAPDHPQANLLMARLNLTTGRISDAERCLQIASKASAEARLALAELLLAMPARRQEALREAKIAEASFRDAVKSDPKDHRARNSLIGALTLLDDFAGAARLAEEGETLYPKENYTEKRARIELLAGMRAPTSDATRWARFAKAYELGWKTPEVLGALLKIALNDPGDEQALRTMLDPYRRGGDEKAATSDLTLGLLSVHRGKAGEAQVLLQRVGKALPNAPLRARQTIEAARLAPTTAADMASALSKTWPDDYEMRQFHGAWMFRAGNAQEALVELESLLPHRQNDPGYFALLADVCRKVGLLDKAEDYRVRATAAYQARLMEQAETARKAKAKDNE
jgi:predicted Zn-dependent protease